MTAKAASVANWIAALALAMTGIGACGTAVWKIAALSTKVDTMRDDITYIKGRIDGAPPNNWIPVTSQDRTGRR